MKIKILSFLIITVAILLIGIGFCINGWMNQYKETRRQENNYIAEKQNSARREDLTREEFKKFYASIDSLGKKIGVKTNRITDYVKIDYNFKDSTITHHAFYRDSVSEKLSFVAPRKCGYIKGYVTRDSISITEDVREDNIDLFIYKDWDKKYLWGLIRRKPFLLAKAYSECAQDTLAVKKFFHVEKNKRKYRKN